MRLTPGFGLRNALLAVVLGACGGKGEGAADAGEMGVRDPHHEHGHAHDPHHGHAHADVPPLGPTNPYVYEPRDAEPEPRPVPQGEPAGEMSFSGVTFEVVIEGRKEVLAFSDAERARRPGPIANWDCNPRYGVVNVVDFAIAEDPKRAGATFVVRVDAAKPGDMRAGTPTDARISIRRVGEAGLTTARGTATWDPGYKSGRAVAQAGLDYALEVRWTCAEKAGGP